MDFKIEDRISYGSTGQPFNSKLNIILLCNAPISHVAKTKAKLLGYTKKWYEGL